MSHSIPAVVTLAAALALPGVARAQEEPTPPPAVTLAPGESPSTLLPPLVLHSRRTARIEDGRLVGDGADLLRGLGRRAHFTMIGEDHGNAGVAGFATAYWRDLHAFGYRYAALEVDPFVAEAAVRELRAGGIAQWARFLASRGGVFGAPFLNWEPEARLAEVVARTAGTGREPPLWGLDQVFIGSAHWQLRDIAAQAGRPEARALAGRLAEEIATAADRSAFARLDGARLRELRTLLGSRRDARWAGMVDAMIVSHRIYQPFTGGPGEALPANAERETLMKRTLQDRYEAATRADGAPPRVMLKFGSNHIYRGATPTWVQGLGGFVTEYGVARGLESTTLLVLCGPGGSIARLDGPPVTCDESLADTFAFLKPHIDAQAVTIFDLRVWRLRPRRWAHLGADLQAAIGSFDALVFVPGGAASPLLPGLPPAAPPPAE